MSAVLSRALERLRGLLNQTSRAETSSTDSSTMASGDSSTTTAKTTATGSSTTRLTDSSTTIDPSPENDLAAFLDRAVANGDVPHAVVYATNADGSFTYNYSTGRRNIEDDASSAIGDDAVFALASSTKLLTTIAVLHAVERGILGLDDDVADRLPELAAQPVLTGLDDGGKPVLVPRTKTITLRRLLTHTAGTTYPEMDPLLVVWFEQQNRVPGQGSTVLERFLCPLVYQPGESWRYSSGLDFAGLLLERATGASLDEYMRSNLWESLGLNTLTFWAEADDKLNARLAGKTIRPEESGDLVANTGPTIYTNVKDCFGGHGMYGTTGEYLAVLRSILANDGRLLRRETVEMMFTPQFNDAERAALARFRSGPWRFFVIGDNPPEIKADWGLGGILFIEPHQRRRKAGTLNWGGLMNTFWIIDPKADLAIAFATQVLPPGDKRVTNTIKEVEEAIYRMAGVEF